MHYICIDTEMKETEINEDYFPSVLVMYSKHKKHFYVFGLFTYKAITFLFSCERDSKD